MILGNEGAFRFSGCCFFFLKKKVSNREARSKEEDTAVQEAGKDGRLVIALS